MMLSNALVFSPATTNISRDAINIFLDKQIDRYQITIFALIRFEFSNLARKFKTLIQIVVARKRQLYMEFRVNNSMLKRYVKSHSLLNGFEIVSCLHRNSEKHKENNSRIVFTFYKNNKIE